MPDTLLTPQQLTVISALSSGVTLTAAAEEAGVHRNTIHYWRRNLRAFQDSLAHAQYDRALYYRDRLEAEIDLAIKALHEILADSKTPPSVRLKAALHVIQTASTPPLPKPQVVYTVESLSLSSLNMNKSAQSAPDPKPSTVPPVAPTSAPAVHKPAQPVAPAPIRPEPPSAAGRSCLSSGTIPVNLKVGRNEPCPCGSGQKYKRCCLNKPSPAASRAA
jgi:hypothetical protein